MLGCLQTLSLATLIRTPPERVGILYSTSEVFTHFILSKLSVTHVATERVVLGGVERLLPIVKLPYTFSAHLHIQNLVVLECHYLPNSLHQQMCFGGKAIPVFPGYRSATCFAAN